MKMDKAVIVLVYILVEKVQDMQEALFPVQSMASNRQKM